MYRHLLLITAAVLSIGGLRAQTVSTVATGTTVTYPAGSTSFVELAASPSTGRIDLGPVETSGSLDFTEDAALFDVPAGCDLIGASIRIQATPTTPNPAAPFNVDVLLPMARAGACGTPDYPTDLPAGFPACAADQVAFAAPTPSTLSVDLTRLSFFAVTLGPILVDVTVTPVTSGGCAATPLVIRFSFTPVAPAPVPVSLRSLAADTDETSDQVVWVAEGEFDLAGYSVERSADGVTFEEVAFVNARGTEDGRREYRQTLPAEGEARYYRLRTVDLDGSSAYSPVVAVNGTGGATAGQRPRYVSASLFAEGAGTAVAIVPADATALEVYDLGGRRVGTYGTALGTRLGVDLPAGHYLVRPAGARAHAPQRFVVQ